LWPLFHYPPPGPRLNDHDAYVVSDDVMEFAGDALPLRFHRAARLFVALSLEQRGALLQCPSVCTSGPHGLACHETVTRITTLGTTSMAASSSVKITPMTVKTVRSGMATPAVLRAVRLPQYAPIPYRAMTRPNCGAFGNWPP
jgi:hypothetical protein